ncbi:GNAT family N-acetyltransferase [Halotalea alkalilenta]|nr:GNAT family N-acetyltransferase [Halotalea alkalilenta]
MLSFREAVSTDLEAILALYSQLVDEDRQLPRSRAKEIFSRIQLCPGHRLLLGISKGAPVCICTLLTIDNLSRGGASYALIENVVTDERHRRCGYARALLDHAVELAWEAGCYKVMLMTGAQDAGTLRFYQRCGFISQKTAFERRRQPVRDES